MGLYEHVPGQRDFSILDKKVSVTEFRRRPAAVWKYLETTGHVIMLTRRGKPLFRLVSIETYACMTDDYAATMAEIEEASRVYREQRRSK